MLIQDFNCTCCQSKVQNAENTVNAEGTARVLKKIAAYSRQRQPIATSIRHRKTDRRHFKPQANLTN